MEENRYLGERKAFTVMETRLVDKNNTVIKGWETNV